MGNWCAAVGTRTDATVFRKVDIESIATELEDLGLNKYGYHRLYNGVTGEYIDTMIFMGPIYYQRLQKFTVDTHYAISHGPSDAITNQPLDKLSLSKWGVKTLLVESQSATLPNCGEVSKIKNEFNKLVIAY